MKIMWCWRCRTEVPMLDEQEFEIISSLYSKGFRPSIWFRIKHGLSLRKFSIDDRFLPMRQKYKELTGFDESNHNAIMHHQISIYGDDCRKCGKPWRTPQASFCAACGNTEK